MEPTVALGRRATLAACGAGLLSLAGCLGGSGADGRDGPHPALAGIDEQPTLGPPQGDAEATIVAFEDPSCSRCRTFAQGTVPEIRSNLVEPGTATFVSRPYPVVYDWGEPAAKALFATFERETDAFWSLQEHFYAEQGSFSTGNVLDRTREFLADETAVDGSAVVEAVENGESDDAVQANLDAGEEAGATVTPSVFLFRDGEFRTKAQGSVSYDAIESALGV